MSKKKKDTLNIALAENFHEMVERHEDALKESNMYSITVDPDNVYSFNEEQKIFIEMYVATKNVHMVAKMMSIDEEHAFDLYNDFNVQKEIYRLNLVIRQKQFHTKMMTVDEMSSWLSSMVKDENVPTSERLNFDQKMRAIDTLLRIQEDMAAIMLHKSNNDNVKIIDNSLENLSTSTIKALLKTQHDTKEEVTDITNERLVLVEQISRYGQFSDEEKEKLKLLTLSELNTLKELIALKLKEDNKDED